MRPRVERGVQERRPLLEMCMSEMLTRCFAVCGLALLAATAAQALDPAGVLILVNRDPPASSQAANLYQQLRTIPRDNVLRLALGVDHQITREQYRTRIVAAVKKR